MENQKQVWNNIAQEWSEFKDEPAEGIVDFLKGQKGNILDLGSGSGRHLVKIKNGEIWLVDFSENMIKHAREKSEKLKINAKLFVSDACELPFGDNFFDGAICISLLHCIETQEKRGKVVEELFRVLKSKAKTKISVWNKDSKRFKKSKKEIHVGWIDKGKRYYYLYEPEEIYALFEKAGFNIIEKVPPERNIIFIVEKP
ncbi:class I SAM-dependent methyltransferase [Candidatus Pacearchaeota archaeon]|nr:class I SAM-dependent methyltransferase [Candidatus Pacearchaeota archaeon]